MNLARVLFKKQQQQQQRDASDDQTRPGAGDDRVPPAVRCPPATHVVVQSPTMSETTARSPRRKARRSADHDDDAASVQCRPRTSSSPLHTTVFKPVRMSLHRRFAQVLPNLLLGTCAGRDRPGYLRRSGWLCSRVVSVLDSGAVGPGFKSQPRRCRVTVFGKLFTPVVPLFTKQQNW